MKKALMSGDSDIANIGFGNSLWTQSHEKAQESEILRFKKYGEQAITDNWS